MFKRSKPTHVKCLCEYDSSNIFYIYLFLSYTHHYMFCTFQLNIPILCNQMDIDPIWLETIKDGAFYKQNSNEYATNWSRIPLFHDAYILRREWYQ